MQIEVAGHRITGQVVLVALAVVVVLMVVLATVRRARRRSAAGAAQVDAETGYETRVATYRAEVAAWHRRRDAFHALLEVARGDGQAQAEGVALLEDDAELTRLHHALVTSASGAPRVALLRNVAQNLNDHELRRPIVPTVPVPVDGLGRRARVAAAEWYVARSAETESLRAMVDQTVVMVPTQTAITRKPVAEVAIAS